MAIGTLTTAFNSSVANMNSWIQKIYDVMIAGGWILVADSGDLAVPISVGALPGAGNQAGYLIFRSNDAGGGLVEYYVKLQFGQSSTNASMLLMYVTVGWGSDGAGNLTGVTSTPTLIQSDGGQRQLLAAPFYVSATTGSLVVSLWEVSSSAAEHIMFSIERTKNSSFAAQNKIHVSTYNRSGHTTQTISQSVVYFLNVSNCPNFVMPAPGGTPVAAIAGLGEVFGFAPGPTSPSINILGVETLSAGSPGDVVPVTHFGAVHNYLVVGEGNFSYFMGHYVGTGYLMRYE